MKVAIVGAGISGLACAYKLHPKQSISVYEVASRIGGHTATIEVNHKGKAYAIDTGFIVYNDWTYPEFIELLNELNVETQATEMSFSVSCRSRKIEYAGTNLNTLFAQRKNLLNPAYLKMLYEIIRFNRNVKREMAAGKISQSITLGDYLSQKGYSAYFKSLYITPMGSAIWSSSLNDIMNFPLTFFVEFFKNHGLLNIVKRPQWRVIKGGSYKYLTPLTRHFTDRIYCNSKIKSVFRTNGKIEIHFEDGQRKYYDQLVLACHSDDALKLLGDASPQEKDILQALPYNNNEVILHTDDSILPASRKAWASWNYHLDENRNSPPCLSYNMNILQGIEAETTFIVTLNANKKINENKILGRFNYAHPSFSLEGMHAQARKSEISGVNNTWYCGAYWKNGFHEDACSSGFEVAKHIQALHGV